MSPSPSEPAKAGGIGPSAALLEPPIRRLREGGRVAGPVCWRMAIFVLHQLDYPATCGPKAKAASSYFTFCPIPSPSSAIHSNPRATMPPWWGLPVSFLPEDGGVWGVVVLRVVVLGAVVQDEVARGLKVQLIDKESPDSDDAMGGCAVVARVAVIWGGAVSESDSVVKNVGGLAGWAAGRGRSAFCGSRLLITRWIQGYPNEQCRPRSSCPLAGTCSPVLARVMPSAPWHLITA